MSPGSTWWRRLWAWLREDFGHVIIAVVGVGVPLYFVGVILFDNSTEDGERERAAARVAAGLPASEPPPTATEQAFLAAFDGSSYSDADLLQAGRMTCDDWDAWASDTHGSAFLGPRLIEMGFGGGAIADIGVAARQLCPSTWPRYLAHLDSQPDLTMPGQDEYPDPEPMDERDWGPRG